MLRRGLGRLLARQRAHPQQQPIAAAGGRLLAWPQQQQLQQLQQPTRGFRHHEGGWWEDHDEGGVVAAEPVERNPEAYRSLLSYVSDARKEEIYRLHKLDPQVYDTVVLSYLFNLSRVRVEAIIRLKASEVESRLQGYLYTEEDDVFDGEMPSSSSTGLPLPPNAPAKKGSNKPPAAPTDPGSLLLLDDENGAETWEDLTLPPSLMGRGGKSSKEEEDMMRAVQAAGAELEVLRRLGVEDTEAGAASLQAWTDRLDEAFLEELGASLEGRAEEARLTTTEAMYDAVQPYEEKGSMDEVKDPGSGFRELERRRQAVLADPLFLQHHAWMGLEKERLELLLAHVKAQRQRAGVSPYEEQELRLAVQAYVAKKEQAVEVFAKLGALRAQKRALAAAAAAAGEGEGEDKGKQEGEGGEEAEAEAALLLKEERALVKAAKTALGARIIDPSELAAARAELLKETSVLQAHSRRASLVKAIRSPQGSSERTALLHSYLSMVKTHAQAASSSHALEGQRAYDHVKFEALQQHRRLLRQDEQGQALYARVGDAAAHARLEQDVMAALEATSEGEARSAYREEDGWDERQRGALAAVLGAGAVGAKKEAAMKTYVHALLSEFSWEEEEEDGHGKGEETAVRALATLLADVHETGALRGKVDVGTVVGELASAVVKGDGLEEGKEGGEGALLQRALVLAAGADTGGGNKESSSSLLLERERGYQATVQKHLHALHARRREALTAALASAMTPGGERDAGALRRYLALLAVSANVEAFDRLSQGVLAGVLPQIQRVFRHKPETVSGAYALVVDHVYGGKELGGEEGDGGIAKLAKLAGRTEAWVEATLLKLLEAQRGGGGKKGQGRNVLPNPILLAANWLSQDCYASGVRSSGALRRLQGEMAQAVAAGGGVGEEELAVQGLGGMNAGEANLILTEALALPIGAHVEGDVGTYEALTAAGGARDGIPIEERARAAKALLEFLRKEDAYQQYTGAVRDVIVEQIEEELRDTIYECSDDLRLDLDPALVDLKPKEHYDVPSLKFRVLNDTEAAVSEKGARAGFVEEEGVKGLGMLGEGAVWRPEGLIPDPSVKKGKEGGNVGGKQRRWSFAFKDTAISGVGKKGEGGKKGKGSKGATVVRDARTGRLRAASAAEEGRRSWVKRKEGLPLKESA